MLADLTLPVVGAILAGSIAIVIVGVTRGWRSSGAVALGVFFIGVAAVFVISLLTIGNSPASTRKRRYFNRAQYPRRSLTAVNVRSTASCRASANSTKASVDSRMAAKNDCSPFLDSSIIGRALPGRASSFPGARRSEPGCTAVPISAQLSVFQLYGTPLLTEVFRTACGAMLAIVAAGFGAATC